MPVYTRGGDRGETSVGAKRVPKDCQHVEIIGEIDELISLLGVIASEIEDPGDIERVTADLMSLNAHIISESKYSFTGQTRWLEERIDELWTEVEELDHFILRFTDKLAAKIHYIRAVCRRVERKLVSFSRSANWLDKNTLAYINRLSDYLFALARWINKKKGGEEIAWISDRT